MLLAGEVGVMPWPHSEGCETAPVVSIASWMICAFGALVALTVGANLAGLARGRWSIDDQMSRSGLVGMALCGVCVALVFWNETELMKTRAVALSILAVGCTGLALAFGSLRRMERRSARDH
jgi:dolichol kinase